MTEQIVIVKMKPEHVAEVAKLEALCFDPPWSEQAYRNELDNPLALVFVAEIAGRLAGYIDAHFVCDECSINNIAVHSDFRRMGAANALLNSLFEAARQKGTSRMMLEVRKSNFPAISLYEKHGFERAGERKNFYVHPVENAILMNKYSF